DLLIGVEADVAGVVLDADFVAQLFAALVLLGKALELAAGVSQVVLKDVAQCDNLDVGGCAQHVLTGARAAAAATDQADFDNVLALGVNVRCQGRQRGPGGGGGLKKVSPACFFAAHANALL